MKLKINGLLSVENLKIVKSDKNDVSFEINKNKIDKKLLSLIESKNIDLSQYIHSLVQDNVFSFSIKEQVLELFTERNIIDFPQPTLWEKIKLAFKKGKIPQLPNSINFKNACYTYDNIKINQKNYTIISSKTGKSVSARVYLIPIDLTVNIAETDFELFVSSNSRVGNMESDVKFNRFSVETNTLQNLEFDLEDISIKEFKISNISIGNVYLDKLQAERIKINNNGVGNFKVSNCSADIVNIKNTSVGNMKINNISSKDFALTDKATGNTFVNILKSANTTISCVKTGSLKLEHIYSDKFSIYSNSLGQVELGTGKVKNMTITDKGLIKVIMSSNFISESEDKND